MKCSICGKEFGEGTNCQNCGVDRVTGLGNYNGYNNPEGSNGYDSSTNEEQTSSRTTVCYACGEIIPSNSEYCPYCSKKLYVTCPKCRKSYFSQFPSCPNCGTNRAKYRKQLKAEREIARKEEEERKEKQKKKEQQQQLINRAEELKRRLTYTIISKGGSCLFFIISEIILFVLFAEFVPRVITNIQLGIFVIILFPLILPCAILMIKANIENRRTKERIEKWKREHPNDPRNKYL